MDITALLKEEAVFIGMDAGDMSDCLNKMVNGMTSAGVVKDAKVYLDDVLEREKKGSTGVGFGVAIPHGKSGGVSKPGLGYASLSHPVEWKSLDEKPVSMVFLIAVPKEQAGDEHLQILMALSRKLIHKDFRDKLVGVKSYQELVELLKTV